MSFYLADGTLNTDYKIGDKFKVVDNKDSCFETTVGEVVVLTRDMYSENPLFDTLDGDGMRCCVWYELVKYDQQPTLYTESELTEVEELQDRVGYLESLCSDYAKIISENDAEIEQLKHSLLAKANNTCVGVEPEEFKPIPAMTIDDWNQAIVEGWEFETLDKGAVKVVSLEPEDVAYGVCLLSEDRTWWVSLTGYDTDEEGWTVVNRIK